MTVLSLLLINLVFAQDEFGLLIKADYKPSLFDRRIYQLRDDGNILTQRRQMTFILFLLRHKPYIPLHCPF